ncbi:hypothetical protein SBBP2_2800002 [Burkholderiales bacterium]|nr:hypothetical protein SBBP2_2800002 [Burkholderiales bacterium]
MGAVARHAMRSQQACRELAHYRREPGDPFGPKYRPGAVDAAASQSRTRSETAPGTQEGGAV